MYNWVGKKLQEILDKAGMTISDLSAAAGISANQWARVIKGSSRLSVDMAIRLGLVFPGGDAGPYVKNQHYWLYLLYESDVLNASEMIGPMYRNIKVIMAIHDEEKV